MPCRRFKLDSKYRAKSGVVAGGGGLEQLFGSNFRPMVVENVAKAIAKIKRDIFCVINGERITVARHNGRCWMIRNNRRLASRKPVGEARTRRKREKLQLQTKETVSRRAAGGRCPRESPSGETPPGSADRKKGNQDEAPPSLERLRRGSSNVISPSARSSSSSSSREGVRPSLSLLVFQSKPAGRPVRPLLLLSSLRIR